MLGERERTGPGLEARPRGVATRAERLLAQLSDGPVKRPPVAIRFWDGSELPADHAGAPGTLLVNDPVALAYLLREPNELGLSRAWIAGALDFDGDLEAALASRQRFRDVSLSAHDRAHVLAAVLQLGGAPVLRRPRRLASEAARRGRRHSLRRDRASVQHHYELPTEFYRLFLGQTMVYSCAYFDSPQDTLEAAQERKLELICRKLRLRPGDRLLDIGCGWGSLIIHAAIHHGVSAVGVTLSPSQAAVANERARAAGVAERCEARVLDYRELHDEQFDAIASVGMYEHVGRDQLGTYVHRVRDLLREGGLFMNHGIVRLHTPPRDDKTLIARFVFPDGELHPLTELLVTLEQAQLEIRDIESLRDHYVLTLRHWVANLARAREQAVGLVGDERTRLWRLYMTGSASAFALGEIAVYQTLAVKPGGEHRLPLNRARLLPR